MILYFDTETTGLTPGQICQLSYVLEGEETVSRKNFYFAVDYIEPGASAVTGLTAELMQSLSGGQVFADRAEEIAADFAAADLVVAHNFRFDYAFMQEEFQRLHRLFRYRKELCTMRYFTPRLKLIRPHSGGYKYPKLSELCAAFAVTERDIEAGIGKCGFHNAMYDAEAVYRCVAKARETDEALCALAGRRGTW